MKIVPIISIALLLIGCDEQPKVVFSNIQYKNIEWSSLEKSKNIALKHLSRNEQSSTHLIRIKGSEKSHYHDTHNLTVSILEGDSIIYFKDHTVKKLFLRCGKIGITNISWSKQILIESIG